MSTYHMADIIPLIGLPPPPYGRSSYNIPCPCCDTSSRDKHLNINLKKDVFRCPRCSFSGGIFDLYAFYTNTSREDVLKSLRERLGDRDDISNFPKPPIGRPLSQETGNELAVTDIETRDATYRALLNKLSLANDHRENLINRGLSNSVIDEKCYRTTPAVGMKVLAKQLLSEGHYLSGVPGFYRLSDGSWTFVQQKRGILIPVCDLDGRIQGLQVRRDNVQRRKFRWISSRDFPDGCQAEGWIHIAGPIRESILLIEGPLKADVVHSLTGQTVLAVPGVNALLELETALLCLRERGVANIMTCFDMDFLKNHYVQSGYYEMLRLISKVGFSYGTYLWDPAYNGLDDYLWEYCFGRQHTD